ncbi:MAG: hypothetical protein F6K21_20600 [Symploca sp. SIO2D2]|nr:hypothetical protein [Symploca sp. SIO2D2]
MKRAIQSLIALTFAIVVACGFQAQPAHAANGCEMVTSTSPCILEIKDTEKHNVRISTGQVLLAVYTNNSFKNPVKVTMSTGSQALSEVSLAASESKWQDYKFNSVNGIVLQATASEGSVDATVVLVQAQSQQK